MGAADSLMTASRHVAVRQDWLDKTREEILEPGLPVVDAHHHLWDRPGARYLFDDFLDDTRSGHDIRATVFVQCRSMVRAAGPEALRPVGETEFVAGVAARSASGLYGPMRACAAIVAMADLMLGDAVAAGAGGAPSRGGRAPARHPQLDRLACLGGSAVQPGHAAARPAHGALFPPRRRAARRGRTLARRLGLPHPAR